MSLDTILVCLIYHFKAKIRDELIMTLTAELPVMRARLGMSQEVMASAIGVSRQTYSAIETRTKKMSWTMFMALIAVLDMIKTSSKGFNCCEYPAQHRRKGTGTR